MRTIWKVSLATAIAIGAAACSDSTQTTEPLAPDVSRGSAQGGGGGVVYTSTNSPEANEVLVFPRAADGSLGTPVAFATGGLGTGGGLGNQDAVVLTSNNRRLLVVNAGSNEVSVFGVEDKGLKLLDRVASGGITPVSIAVRRSLVYVLNAGGTGNITGFRLDAKGKLHPIPNSTRPLSSPTAGAAQVSFSPVANVLVVTEKATNVISTYIIQDGGLTTGPNVQKSVGATPFGFAFRRNGTLVVSEAFGGAPDASALSSYNVSSIGTLSVISPSVATTETAACWVVITSNGRFVYTSNTGSNTISGYRLSPSGELFLLDADGVTATTMSGPIDLALTRSSHYLYSLDSGSGAISAFGVQTDGSLTPASGASGLPSGATGLAAL